MSQVVELARTKVVRWAREPGREEAVVEWRRATRDRVRAGRCILPVI